MKKPQGASERSRLLEFDQPAGAVGEGVEADADLVEQRQVEVGQRRRLRDTGCGGRPALPAAPPATRIGRFAWSCTLGLPMPLPYR